MNIRRLSVVLILLGSLVSIWALWRLFQQQSLLINPSASLPINNLPNLDASAYAFEVLKTRIPQASEIQIVSLQEEADNFSSYIFTYLSDQKKVSGQLNVPKQATPSAGFPIVVMLRGFVDPANYVTGTGTKNAAAVFASNGFVTIAPDFLGYGLSDPPDKNALLARLRRPVTVIDLLASLNSLQIINDDNIFMWGHSNGGQIALSVLEITQKEIPTTLWAPVSKPFPYSILFYTDEYDDGGKALRQEIARFEVNHDVFHYSIDQYWDWLKAPIQLHQGGADFEVPKNWSDELSGILEDRQLLSDYFFYPSSDHNMRPDWNTVVARDLAFFKENLQ